jgi:hypothetical protein
MTDNDFLDWIYARMVKVHNENELVDYMQKFKDIIKKGKMTENIQKYPDVNRVEVISSEGEEFFWDEWDECSKVQVSFHNDGKTLKVFLTGNIK